ncbi:chloramphenicol 3-O-phosphotransferase [Mycobacterium sp. URHB0021]
MAVIAGTGQVVLLNGASSAGKSSIAERLLADFERPWFHMAVDDFGAMRAHRQACSLKGIALADVLYKTHARFHRAVAGMAMAGNDVVMGHVLSEPWRLADLLEVMAEIDVVLIGCTARLPNSSAGRRSVPTGCQGPRPVKPRTFMFTVCMTSR